MGGECVSCGGLALLHLIVGSRGWLCGWLYQMMLTRKASPLSVEDKLAHFLWFICERIFQIMYLLIQFSSINIFFSYVNYMLLRPGNTQMVSTLPVLID